MLVCCACCCAKGVSCARNCFSISSSQISLPRHEIVPVLAVIVDAGIFHHCPASHLSNHVCWYRMLRSSATHIQHSPFAPTEILGSILQHWLLRHGRHSICRIFQPCSDTVIRHTHPPVSTLSPCHRPRHVLRSAGCTMPETHLFFSL